MKCLKHRQLVAALLTAVLLIPAGSAFGNDWSKPKSRLRGATIGAAAGAVLGPPGMVVGGAIGNGVQYARHSQRHHRHHAAHRYHHYRR